jgi:integral membrane sensor domain MASE1
LGAVQTIVVVAVAYVALGALSAFFAYSNQDAWGVWLTSGLGLGLLLGRARSDWMPVLAGAFVGAMIFEPLVGSSLADTLGFALIEVVVTVVGGAVAAQLSAPPLRFVSPRDVGAIIAGAFALALAGAVLVGTWDYFTGRPDGWRTFGVWLLGNFVAMLLIAPFIASWAQFRVKRPGAGTLLSFVGGAVACALFLLCIHALFSSGPAARFLQSFGVGRTYLPFVFFVLVALLWGARGATLAALVSALVAITQTVRGFGPFAGGDGIFDDPVLNAQGYAVALSITGLLVVTVLEARRVAKTQARA